ncbi:MAG: hypothetical protein ACRDSN_19960 [Pseudonocardiaceae bacterium]
MNISEANAVNTVLHWVLGTPDGVDGHLPDDVARKDAAWLADRAHRAVWAGLTGADVEARWPPGGRR